MSAPEENLTRSARTWIVGTGHVSLEEARKWSVDQVAAAEQAIEQLEVELEAAQAVVRRDVALRDAAFKRLAEVKQRHLVALEDLNYRMQRTAAKGEA